MECFIGAIMVEVATILSVIFALFSLIAFKHKLSEFFVSASAILLLLPVLAQLPALATASVLALIITFEVIALNSELWRQRAFKPIYQSRAKVLLIGLSLTIGVSATTWWWQNSNPSGLTLNLEEGSWWKVILTLFLAFHLTALLKTSKGKRDYK